MENVNIKNFNLEKIRKKVNLSINFEIGNNSFDGNLALDFKEIGIEKEILNFENLNKKDFIELDKIILEYLENNLTIERWEILRIKEMEEFRNGKFYKILGKVYYSDFLFSAENIFYNFFYETEIKNKPYRIINQKNSNYNYFKVFVDKVKKVYFEGKEIIGADEESFEYIDGSYSKDKNNVYYFNEKINQADVKTFKEVESSKLRLMFDYEYQDKNFFYKNGKPIKKTFFQKIFG